MTNDEKALVFPCEFPIKIFGKKTTDFEVATLAIIKKHVEELKEDALSYRESEQSHYVAITVTITAESKAQLDDLTKRRAELAEQKIAQAEAAAVKEIRTLTVDIATSAARDLIEANMKKEDHEAPIKSGTDKLDAKLH